MHAVRLVSVLLLVLPVLAGASLAAQPVPTIVSFSGSPLLLEIAVPDPDHTVTRITLSGENAQHLWHVPEERTDAEVLLAARPFLQPGVYDLELAVEREGDSVRPADRIPLRIGFVDWVFGRDNLRFGNNTELPSLIGTYGEVLESWLEERFGEVGETDLVLLVDFMYGLFGRNTGRCYSFSGTAVRYRRWPELLPSYYDATYDLRATSSRNQRAMSYLQLDMVFSHFVARGAITTGRGPMSREEMRAQAREIVSRVARGEPVAVGFTGPDLHHSMVVFGFVSHPADGVLDLLVANNWKSGEELNLRSRDAEIVRLRLDPTGDDQPVEWLHESGRRDREIDRFFVVEVRKDPYVHDRADLDGFLATMRERFRAAGRAVLIVENAAGAALTTDDASTGRIRTQTREELPDVQFERRSRAFRFSFPADREYALEIADDRGARVLLLAPDAMHGERTWIEETEAPEEDGTVIRRMRLWGE